MPALTDEAAVNQRVAGLEKAAATLPPELMPTIRFEEALVRVLGRVNESDWLPAMRTLATASGTDPVAAAVREAAKAWIARAAMREIGVSLDDYYAQNVRYPGALAEIERALPQDLRADPWGEPWVYRLHAPVGFPQQTGQRYTLGPKRYPELGTLREATVDRPALTPPAWKLALRAVGESVALEFRLGPEIAGLLQPGGKIGEYTLVYVGDHWALMAAPDQLFAVPF